ncbi:MAG: rhamnopyranosyl-N-acetylglucosaminyl-diphospho-decaprenol beta,3/1,4-galactofuranosyltransferase [Pseudonocardiales bacterium]|jgi:rhamnopyranosyl-N-acetylglucosaminyl-diphospho-decaprenol beta-1,3/1,4-galactofuranosyltransferase|nr:galactofuranosyl transferase [Pseudonocardia sp.]MDT7558789.1 rhamnopyranosyl-N-acetylglucosaminyl-diphospho-decaprenol beta,3/1,4-galactofuranosyltransferase [Pseudonocardiales bacterium]MDT7566678.1 rhamnopyranosyl-N-acetylglucosaminyl-diphospho-decaprenol beta,3/1,4-galactofuranosyltransferase [Pseudonocardiales bacterium]MDT7589055.1 rhamnopyranosyl-N-acetylglucosaminyl-diphospho-decaprenol beta,3/1,4-galactofuranosyltransferase [Pseudonocardiales bacterium]MDT7593039.1 rhamnopyranosyl-N
MTAPLAPDSVVAVVVTRHRSALLVDSLAAMAKQTHPVTHLVVVDNGPDQPARDVVEACGLPVTYLQSWHNLGGAGGFALGMLHALALGAEWVWLGDDDGRAADEHVLATLLDIAKRRELAVVSPVVADQADPETLAFPLRRGLRWHRGRDALGGPDNDELLPGIASFFNGALFRASTLDVVGVPDLRLFVRGDEVEMHRRVVRSGLPFGTCLRAAYVHPNGSDEFKPMLGGRLHAQDPEDPVKRYYTYRNRGYLFGQRGMRLIGALELARFGWYFLISKRDPAGFREWLRLVRLGRREQFHRAP